jgi:hypothetical protein
MDTTTGQDPEQLSLALPPSPARPLVLTLADAREPYDDNGEGFEAELADLAYDLWRDDQECAS